MTGSEPVFDESVVATVAAAIIAAHAEGLLLTAPAGGHVLDAGQAYVVQARITAARLDRGEHIIGWKLGYTSAVMREQMGIAEPNFGPLTDAMLLEDGASVPSAAHQPRVEPEIALVLGDDVTRVLDSDGIRGHVASAHLALEVVDSVWQDYRFGWADNTADGSSAAYVVLGPQLHVADLAGVVVELEHNGAPVGSGRGSHAMGDPFEALAWLGARLIETGRHLRAGDVVITGGLTRAVPLAAGDRVVAHAGSVSVTVMSQESVGPWSRPHGTLR